MLSVKLLSQLQFWESFTGCPLNVSPEVVLRPNGCMNLFQIDLLAHRYGGMLWYPYVPTLTGHLLGCDFPLCDFPLWNGCTMLSKDLGMLLLGFLVYCVPLVGSKHCYRNNMALCLIKESLTMHKYTIVDVTSVTSLEHTYCIIYVICCFLVPVEYWIGHRDGYELIAYWSDFIFHENNICFRMQMLRYITLWFFLHFPGLRICEPKSEKNMVGCQKQALLTGINTAAACYLSKRLRFIQFTKFSGISYGIFDRCSNAQLHWTVASSWKMVLGWIPCCRFRRTKLCNFFLGFRMRTKNLWLAIRLYSLQYLSDRD